MQRGAIRVDEIPAPTVDRQRVIIRVEYSCISAGTETSQLHATKMPLWKRALQKPEKAKEFLGKAMREGFLKVKEEIERKLNSPKPTGYSIAGRVIEVGEEITDLQIGDLVAAAGSQFAHHSEQVSVPRNLCVRIPLGVSTRDASSVTLGAIALQGVRRANPTMGEKFVVVGLGILGQLTVQLLKANGCEVLGTDFDLARKNLAEKMGAQKAIFAGDSDVVDQVMQWTNGVGADGVIITAATASNEPIQSAFEMCRRKGRVVLVGDVGLQMKRDELYAKEIDFLISTSYGPGRYDPRYEENGLDYPIGYVRWTENRNMEAYLDLLASGQVRVGELISDTFSVDQAPEAFELIQGGSESRPMMVLLSYPHPTSTLDRAVRLNFDSKKKRDGSVSISVIGAGSFAKEVHLPHIKSHPELFNLRSVVSRSGYNAKDVATSFGAEMASTDYQSVLSDEEVDSVLIATRHDLHAKLTLAALQAGKHVLVEKPLALNEQELAPIIDFYSQSNAAQKPLLLTGFNRRFSPAMKKIREWIHGRGPMMIQYTMNAGYIPLDHWVHSSEGGGRNIGEACHIYDLFVFLTGSKAAHVSTSSLRPTSNHFSSHDNFSTSIHFEDGSVATLLYTALGSKAHPKERLEVFAGGRVGIVDDFRSMTLVDKVSKKSIKLTGDKGQKSELIEFRKGIESGNWPNPFWQQIEATRISFAVEKQLLAPKREI